MLIHFNLTGRIHVKLREFSSVDESVMSIVVTLGDIDWNVLYELTHEIGRAPAKEIDVVVTHRPDRLDLVADGRNE